jgi:hypothetical protein
MCTTIDNNIYNNSATNLQQQSTTTIYNKSFRRRTSYQRRQCRPVGQFRQTPQGQGADFVLFGQFQAARQHLPGMHQTLKQSVSIDR